jgi:hypothetical protein
LISPENGEGDVQDKAPSGFRDVNEPVVAGVVKVFLVKQVLYLHREA